jgi:hypothetical protein
MSRQIRTSRRRDNLGSNPGSRRLQSLSAAIGLTLFAALVAPVEAQISIGVGFSIPGARIGISVPLYPDFVAVPGYPVYYAPQLDLNLFFYDGLYWSYSNDQWYSSAWYDGPWDLIGPQFVPLFVLRVPVRYYRRPPSYFGGWLASEPPRWGDHWGRDWQQRRRGWDHWDRRSNPVPAPLPAYQRDYRGNRYPAADQQHSLRAREYNYQPHDPVARQHFNATPPLTPNRSGSSPPARPDRPPNRSDAPADVRGAPVRGNEREDASPRARPQPTEPRAASPGEMRREPAPRPEAPRPASEPTRAAAPAPAQRANDAPRPRPDNAPRSQPEERRGAERAPAPDRARDRPARGGDGGDDRKPDRKPDRDRN